MLVFDSILQVERHLCPIDGAGESRDKTNNTDKQTEKESKVRCGRAHRPGNAGFFVCVRFRFGLTAFALFPTRDNTTWKRSFKIDPLLWSLIVCWLSLRSVIPSIRTSCGLCLIFEVDNCTRHCPALSSPLLDANRTNPIVFLSFLSRATNTTKGARALHSVLLYPAYLWILNVTSICLSFLR